MKDPMDSTSETACVPLSQLGPRRSAETSAPDFQRTARLICVAGSCVGASFSLGNAPMTVGRADSAEIVVTGTEISRAHARVEFGPDGFVVTDLDSRNGTYVNGDRILERVLVSGDRIQLGTSTILLFSRQDELERRVSQLQKLESMAQLAGGMVHDFKNTLGIVLMNAELLAKKLVPGTVVSEEAAEMVRDILTAAQTSFAVTHRLLFFARRHEPRASTELNVLVLVEEVLGMVRRSLETVHSIDIVADVDPRLVVGGERDELIHTLLNLVLNAKDAMPSGGTLRIAAAVHTFGRAAAFALHLPDAGRFVEISVADTGGGMSDDVQARIFEPFFTTKPAGAGTGLGLSTVYGIVRAHGGNVLVESSLGAGSRFRVILPSAR
jgi:signal transduction histidine kinase